MTMLKRDLMTEHGLTPAEYRTRWDGPPIIRWGTAVKKA